MYLPRSPTKYDSWLDEYKGQFWEDSFWNSNIDNVLGYHCVSVFFLSCKNGNRMFLFISNTWSNIEVSWLLRLLSNGSGEKSMIHIERKGRGERESKYGKILTNDRSSDNLYSSSFFKCCISCFPCL